MSKNVDSNKNLPSPRVPIHTCEGLYQKLKYDYDLLEKKWDEYNAFNFTITASHLFYDWIDKVGSVEQRKRKGRLSKYGKILFKILGELANANKHWDLDRGSKENQIVTNITDKRIWDMYAFLYSGPVNYVQIDNIHLSFPVLTSLILECLEWVLNGESNSFPANIEDKLVHYLSVD